MKRLLLLTLLLLSVPGMAAPKYRVQVRNQFVGLICLLGELPLLTTQKSGQVLVNAEVSTDKPLLTTDIGVHDAFAQHHSVIVPQSSDLPETFNQSLCCLKAGSNRPTSAQKSFE